MKGKPIGKTMLVSSIAAGTIAAILVVCFILFAVWTMSMGKSLSRVSFSGQNAPVTLTVFGRGTDTLSAQLRIGTADGDVAAIIERSWEGWELNLDCVMVATGSGWLAFPYRLYTDETDPGSGVDLIHYYDLGGMPALYESTRLSAGERASLRRLFALVKTERWIPRFLGRLPHEVVRVRSYEPNAEYSLRVSRKGKLSFSLE
ncbi:MAG TPA: hypothetical protein PKO22_02735 [Treponemataceae bacterium]|nr:hypothetical protein [Treponemataceae bacterium]